ncbi:hypothetical protein IAR55_005390 [Kwoniella newhampshirensis]|uniref:STB6-like N-terminal domain-containing protein n=1 Tax=Kwoniella newhampshirensis TaxID=1651941 RepID=A0AAW0YH95_9TREE
MSFVLSPVTVSSLSPTPSTPSRFPTPAPSSIGPAPTNGLLIPTDRTLEELEGKWLSKLGRLKVDREVVLSGYALYSLRNWFLSRTHFSHTIVTQTGKPTEHISAYFLVPLPDLSPREAANEIARATQFLASETQSSPRKTEHGTLLVTTPSAFGQDINPIPGGDFRVAQPYIIVNTGLRRLGCGGRAFLGLESPIPALRRKFHELYRIPVPAHAAPLSRTTSPSSSPSNNLSASPLAAAQDTHDAINSDPFTYLVIELVKLIQSALALWGMFGLNREDMEIDGLFCDETKAAIFQWRRVMGMEHEESLKLEKETSGGCIDPKTLAALLSSVTSVHYELDVLDLPKDPFTSIRRFLNAWAGYQTSVGKAPNKSQFLNVSSVRNLNHHYLADRTRSPGDALKVHRLLFSGVAQATSSLQANLKGGAAEDTPIRKREHHLRFRADDEDSDSGMVMIIPEGQVGSVAPPDVITTDLEAYTRGILKSREKDWDLMGARRLAELWNGTVAESLERSPRRRGRPTPMSGANGQRHDRSVLRKRTVSKDFAIKEEDGEDNLKGAIKEISERAGQALKGGFGLVSRKNTAYETSDSETGGPGPSSLRSALTRKKQNTVPTVIEPDLEEVDEELDGGLSASPSPSASTRHLHQPMAGFNTTRASFLTANPRADSKRLSIITNPSGNDSDVWSRHSYRVNRSPGDEVTDQDHEVGHRGDRREAHSTTAGTTSDRATIWRVRGRAPKMLRTASDGADVIVEENGMEWEVTNPHGTGKRDGHGELKQILVARRHSFEHKEHYRDVRRLAPEQLQVDVEMCAVVLELRERERQLAQRVKDVKLLEECVFQAGSRLVVAARSRRNQVDILSDQAARLRAELEALEIEEDHEGSPRDRFHYYLSEETHRPELLDDLGRLKEMWEEVRSMGEKRRQEVEGEVEVTARSRGWFW